MELALSLRSSSLSILCLGLFPYKGIPYSLNSIQPDTPQVKDWSRSKPHLPHKRLRHETRYLNCPLRVLCIAAYPDHRLFSCRRLKFLEKYYLTVLDRLRRLLVRHLHLPWYPPGLITLMNKSAYSPMGSF